jgi:hypothetical protein
MSKQSSFGNLVDARNRYADVTCDIQEKRPASPLHVMGDREVLGVISVIVPYSQIRLRHASMNRTIPFP